MISAAIIEVKRDGRNELAFIIYNVIRGGDGSFYYIRTPPIS